ncbi:MAG: poly granule associated protein, partial [Xanthomonadales bacterium]|nr:phasin family protein [Xanthomonadales bacterium]NIX13112.1 poly granule associated protein [Xanthomonadales bacterium]
ARVLGRLGVPTADDVNKLSARVQKLSRQVADMSKAGTKKRTTTRKRTTKKATTRSAAS